MDVNTLPAVYPANFNNAGVNFLDVLSRWIGTTVTIFTTSGGQSGYGFTGVLMAVTPTFVRLITQIGPAPGCALGNGCVPGYQTGGYGYSSGYGSYGNNIQNVGSVTDIPTDRIASFTHNAI